MRISDWSSDVCSSDLAKAGTRTVHRLYLATAFILLRKKHASGTKDGVVALVVDKVGNIVSWGMKNPDVSCWHGETSAVMRLGGHVPEGGCVFSTLKPCKMCAGLIHRSEEHTSELQSLMRSSYAGFCLKKKNREQ